MVGEKATTDITISKDSQGFEECKDSAVEGGTIAKNTRKELEEKTGKRKIHKNKRAFRGAKTSASKKSS
jgi:hypothetical protein